MARSAARLVAASASATPAAVSSTQVVAEFRAGHLVSFGSARANPSLGGVRAAGSISSCPIIEVNP